MVSELWQLPKVAFCFLCDIAFSICCLISIPICNLTAGVLKFLNGIMSKPLKKHNEDINRGNGNHDDSSSMMETLRSVISYVMRCLNSGVNWIYWNTYIQTLCRKLYVQKPKSAVVPKVAIMEADMQMEGKLATMCSEYIQFSSAEMSDVSDKLIIIIPFDMKGVWLSETSYENNTNLSKLEKVMSEKKNADIMVIMTGLDQRHNCWFWNLYKCPEYIQEYRVISGLIEQKKFLTISDEGTLNWAHDKRILQWAYEVNLYPLSIVGFSTNIRKYVLEMINKQILTSGHSIKDIDRLHLARPSDFQPAQLHRKVLLLCSYTERDNIMIDSPDVGELTEVYQTAEQHNVDVIVMYAGVVREKAHCSDNDLFAPNFTRLLRKQPKLRGLIEDSRFFTVSNEYKLNQAQTKRLIEWLSPPPHSLL